MPLKYGKRSRDNIAELDGRLQRLLHRYADLAPAELDLTITVGHRGEAAQRAAFQSGNSKLDWPRSKHNRQPSLAFDFVPYPFDGAATWKDLPQFGRIAGGLLVVASLERIAIRWGGDWDQDGRTVDERLRDYGHIELLG